MADSAAFSVFGALSGCMGCMIGVESIAKESPSAMNLMTFASFLFISAEGFFVTTKFFTIKNKIPLRGYVPVVLTFFLCNVINNQALNFHVPVPLHIIFRSGSLLTSLVMSRLLLKRRYTLKKYVSVLSITIGIILCTLATASLEKKSSAPEDVDVQKHYRELIIGIVMLASALVISSYLAICQERMYATYGKHPREAMFYIHAISLPFFAFMGRDIYDSALKFSSGPPLLIGNVVFFEAISLSWIKLFVVSILQWMCILFVYNLGSQLDSLSVTLVVTLRKFLSLLISIFWFRNAFTFTHWIGAALVFIGTLAFSDVIGPKSLPAAGVGQHRNGPAKVDAKKSQ